MARFADYLEAGYLPGEVRRVTYGDASPSSVLNYELSKRVKFKPSSNIAGKYLQEFTNLQSFGPDYLINKSITFPEDFLQFLQASQSEK